MASIRERDAAWQDYRQDPISESPSADRRALLQAGDALVEAVAEFFHADAERQSVALDEMLDALARWREVAG